MSYPSPGASESNSLLLCTVDNRFFLGGSSNSSGCRNDKGLDDDHATKKVASVRKGSRSSHRVSDRLINPNYYCIGRGIYEEEPLTSRSVLRRRVTTLTVSCVRICCCRRIHVFVCVVQSLPRHTCVRRIGSP